jgi:uncharacterized protein YkwD
MKSLAMGLLASLALIGAARAESPYERLVIVKPEPLVVRAREADRLVADVNRIRDRQGLPEVAVDDLLSRAALLHARDMARRGFFGHFSPDGGSLPDRLSAIGFHWSVAAENIALDEDEPHANAAFLQSAPHRANILDPRVRKIGVAAVGVGVGAALYVEDFAL